MCASTLTLDAAAFDTYRDAAARLMVAAFANTPKAGTVESSLDLLSLMATDGGDFVVQFQNGALVGLATGMKFTPEMLRRSHFQPFAQFGAREEEYYFAYIATDPKRRAGVAASLLDAQLVRAAGLVGWARTWQGNTNVICTLPRRKFEVVGEHGGDVYFRRELC